MRWTNSSSKITSVVRFLENIARKMSSDRNVQDKISLGHSTWIVQTLGTRDVIAEDWCIFKKELAGAGFLIGQVTLISSKYSSEDGGKKRVS